MADDFPKDAPGGWPAVKLLFEASLIKGAKRDAVRERVFNDPGGASTLPVTYRKDAAMLYYAGPWPIDVAA